MAVIILTVTLILLLLFTSKITAIIEKGEKFKISFVFSLFTFVLNFDSNNKKQGSIKKGLITPIFKSLRYLFRKSEVDIHRLRLFGTERLSEGTGPIFAFISISSLLSYIAKNSKSFKISDRAYLITPPFANEDAAPYINLSLKFSFACLFISVIIFVYYLIRNSFLKKVENAG